MIGTLYRAVQYNVGWCPFSQCVTVNLEANRDQMKRESFLLLSVLFVPVLSRKLICSQLSA